MKVKFLTGGGRFHAARFLTTALILTTALLADCKGVLVPIDGAKNPIDGAKNEDRKDAIIKQWNQVKSIPAAPNRYEVNPVIQSNNYQAGKLSAEYVQEALAMLNFCRFLAGLPNNVRHNDGYSEFAQHGTVVLAAINNTVTHTPSKPDDMEQGFFDKGYRGTSSSNLAANIGSLTSAIQGWIYDGDRSNRDRVGHRRWILNPGMGATGFGHTGRYTAMYAFDRSGPSVDYDAILWPNGPAFPVDFFGYYTPWSITLNPGKYQTPNIDEVTVRIRGPESGRVWSFSNSHADGYFNIDTAVYGVANCIIFTPSGIDESGGYVDKTFNVEVQGIKTSAGASTSFSYSVAFFYLE